MTRWESIQSYEILGWQNIVPGISIFLRNIDDMFAYVEFMINGESTYHRYKIYENGKGKFISTKLGRIRLDGFFSYNNICLNR